MLSGRRILVVEDDRLIALDLQDILEGFGCTVVGPVASAKAALELLREDVPDAAILDVHLNGGTSQPVAEALRTQGRPFVVVTAYQRSYLTGALRDAPLLTKPVDERKLRGELSALIRGNSISLHSGHGKS
jgi:two-component system, response regulator PdtaR